MIRKLNHKNIKGQTALILILLTAGALIFFAITLNWGRIAQTKSLVTIAADQAATMLASEAASYGEMEKQTYLGNRNEKSGFGGYLIAVLLVIVTIIVTIISWGTATWVAILIDILLIASIVMSIVNLALQLAVVQPGITELWTKMQKDQPITQQFFESGLSTALEGAVTDQVNITDYFDLNTNGVFGLTGVIPNDTIGRFAFFYTDRLKMLQQPLIPQVVFFYDQLGEFINGTTCAQNQSDITLYPNAISAIPACVNLNCGSIPPDPACQMPIPGGFQLNDTCSGSDPGNPATYSPYCDPCCQPLNVPDPLYSSSSSNPLHSNQYISIRPSYCDQSTSTQGPSECQINNPYGSYYPFLYDPAFQNYAAGKSFLAQFGRDQQQAPFNNTISSQGSAANGIYFPNGIYPFFWLMTDYSPEVDTITPASASQGSGFSQLHWCSPANATANGVDIPTAPAAPADFPDLTQLGTAGTPYVLPYTCQGADCCVNKFANNVTNNNGVLTPSGLNNDMVIDMVGSGNFPYSFINSSGESMAGVNPANSTNFGESMATSTPYGGVPTTWTPGDNQMCVASWPYNAKTSDFPDGTCEYTASTVAPPPEGSFTVDKIDDVMHTLSDFDAFALPLLNKSVGQLSATFDSWFPQAAAWIAPMCPACTETKFDTPQSCPSQTACNPGTINGRLLNIVYPANYPNLPGGGAGPAKTVDVFTDWKAEMTAWLSNTYTNANAWCLPPETSAAGVSFQSQYPSEYNYITNNTMPVKCDDGTACSDGKCTDGTACIVQTSCDDGSACKAGKCSDNSACSVWGDMPHVIACLNYYGGTSSSGSSATYAYNQCLAALPVGQGICPSSLPTQCASSNLGRTLLSGTGPTFTSNEASSTLFSAEDKNGNNTILNDLVNAAILKDTGDTVNGDPEVSLTASINSTTKFNNAITTLKSYVTYPSTLFNTIDNILKEMYYGYINCDQSQAGSYASWINENATLLTDEAPKFALRSQYLSDVYTRAQTMNTIFTEADVQLQAFLKPCAPINSCPSNAACPSTGRCSNGTSCGACSGGGPAAQLLYADTLGQPTANLPNAIIYGWVDKTLPNGKTISGRPLGAGGYAHLVKVTAYSPGRSAGVGNIQSQLPWINTWTTFIARKFALAARDGYVYVDVKRWDEDHANSLTFPNNRPLWQFTFHNPNPAVLANSTVAVGTTQGLPSACRGLSAGSISGIGYGFVNQTLAGLGSNGLANSSLDQTALQNAFMLNDRGDGTLDLNANGTYQMCLTQVNQLLDTGVESHACAEYVASHNASGPSKNCDQDYSLKFVDCNTIDGNNPPTDLGS